MGLSLLIFDCDGVIIESVDIKGEAFHKLGCLFGEEAADRLLVFHKANGGTSRYVKFAWLFEQVLGKNITPQDEKKLNDIFVEYCIEGLKNCPLVPGLLDVLDRWKGKIPMYVASGAPQDELVYVLEHKKLSHYFDEIYGSPPSKTTLLRSILNKTKALPWETVMVGDSQVDLLAAKETETLFYGRGDYFAGSSYPHYEDLTKLNDYLEELLQK